MKKIFTFLIFILIFPKSLISKDNDDFSLELRTHKVNHKKLVYTFEQPTEWEYNSQEEIDGAKYILLYPKIKLDTNRIDLQIFPKSYEVDNFDFPVMMIQSISKIDSKSLEIKDLIDSIQNKNINEFKISNIKKP